jgi:membrane protease YdiL (CAAX protease family)
LQHVPPSRTTAYQPGVVLALVLARFGWTSRAGFNTPSHWKQLHLLWFPALVALFDLGPLAQMHAPTVGLLLLAALFAALYALLTGLNEEGQFRGFVLTSLEPLGPLRAAAASAVLFGLVHLNNFLPGGNVGLVALQVPSAALFGFGYAAVRLRTGTIWPLLVVHALTDMATDLFLLSPTGSAAFAGGTGTFSPVVLALVLLTPALL